MNIYHKNPEVLINVSPAPTEVFTNTRIRIFITKNNNLVNFTCDWRRVFDDHIEVITNHQHFSYECSVLDMHCSIEARIKYEVDGVSHNTSQRFGPVRLESELAVYLQNQPQQSQQFKLKIVIEGISVEATMIAHRQHITILTKQAQEYTLKLDILRGIQFKKDSRSIIVRMHNYADSFIKYLSVVTKRQFKHRIAQVDWIFESKIQKDKFVVLTRCLSKHVDRVRDLKLKVNRKTENQVSQKNPNNASTHSIKPKQEKISINRHVSHAFNNNLHSNQINTNKSSEYLSVFEEQNDIARDIESIGLGQASKSQQALNLRQSFVQMEQNNTRSKKELNMLEDKQVRIQLDQANSQIRKLLEQVALLRQQNSLLRQQQLSNQQICHMKQKLQYLIQQNQRLETQRTQIIADKINVEMRFQKQRQQNMSLKLRFEQQQRQLESPLTVQYNRSFRTISKSPIKQNVKGRTANYINHDNSLERDVQSKQRRPHIPFGF